MLIVAHHFSQAGPLRMVVVMALVVFHALHCLLLQQVHTVHHPQGLALHVHGLQNRLHPSVGFAAQIEEQIALLHCQNVRRGGLVGMALCSRRQQKLHLCQLSPGGPGEIIGGEYRSHHCQPLFPLMLRRSLSAGGQQKHHRQRGTQPNTFFHSLISFENENCFQIMQYSTPRPQMQGPVCESHAAD